MLNKSTISIIKTYEILNAANLLIQIVYITANITAPTVPPNTSFY